MSVRPSPEPDDDPPRKAMLFCPECGHEIALGDDWLVEERHGGTAYVCPDCATEIAARDRLAGSPRA